MADALGGFVGAELDIWSRRKSLSASDYYVNKCTHYLLPYLKNDQNDPKRAEKFKDDQFQPYKGRIGTFLFGRRPHPILDKLPDPQAGGKYTVKSRMSKRSRRSSRRNRKHRKSHRRQRGGGSCAAMPLNREVFAQRGGMAPYSTGDATLLDKSTMIQAQSWQQVADIDAAQGLAKQAGGARRRRSRKGRSRKGRSRRGRKHRRSQRRLTRSSSFKQRGGSYPWATGLQGFDKPYTLVPAGTATGVNPQFQTEGSVNSLYSESRGPQY